MTMSSTNQLLVRAARCLVLLVTLGAATPAWAQEATVSEYAYRRLEKAQKALSNDKYREALSALDDMKKRESLSNYEKSLMWQTYAFVYAGQNRLGDAAGALQQVLALAAMPEDRLTDIYFNLGQLQLSREKPKLAIEAFNGWVKRQKKASPESLHIVAIAYAQVERFDVALKFIEPAIRGKRNAPDSWLQLQLACLVQLKRWNPAAEVLETLVERDMSNASRWRQLSAMYAQGGRDPESVATLELMYHNDLLDKEKDVLLLVRNLLASGVPYKGAKILEEAMQKKLVSPSFESLELLGNAYLTSGDTKDAIEPLTRAARIAKSGRIYVQVGQLLVNLKRYREASKNIRAGLATGNLKNVGQAQLLLGIAEYQAKDLVAARRAFLAARKHSGTKGAASSWLNFMKKSS